YPRRAGGPGAGAGGAGAQRVPRAATAHPALQPRVLLAPSAAHRLRQPALGVRRPDRGSSAGFARAIPGGDRKERAVRRATTVGRGAKPPSERTTPARGAPR